MILNSVHNSIYGEGPFDVTSMGGMVAACQQHSNSIKLWRETLLENLEWHDHDPPSTDLGLRLAEAAHYPNLVCHFSW